MARKKSSAEQASSYVFMCMRIDNKNYHVDFKTKEEAINYANNLKDKKAEWWGIYEMKPNREYLTTVTYKRLITFDKVKPPKREPEETISIVSHDIVKPKKRTRTKSK